MVSYAGHSYYTDPSDHVKLHPDRVAITIESQWYMTVMVVQGLHHNTQIWAHNGLPGDRKLRREERTNNCSYCCVTRAYN